MHDVNNCKLLMLHHVFNLYFWICCQFVIMGYFFLILFHICITPLCQCTNRPVCVFLLAAHTDGQPTESADWFCKWLGSVSDLPESLRYAVFGLVRIFSTSHHTFASNFPVLITLLLSYNLSPSHPFSSTCIFSLSVYFSLSLSLRLTIYLYPSHCGSLSVSLSLSLSVGLFLCPSARHHTNPMCPEWRWKMDPAEEILQVALGHPQSRIRHFRGPKAWQAEHCALSLVVEPIMYSSTASLSPTHISPLFAVLSRSLVPVVQLCVCKDTIIKDSLKKMDRPLFRDFWPRFLDSLKGPWGEGYPIQRQRTVYRLTLVKAWTLEEPTACSEPMASGQPDFREVKVGLCSDRLPDPAVLIVHRRIPGPGGWWIWIDYDRCQVLVRVYEESGGGAWRVFSPPWTTWPEPQYARHQRRIKTKDASGC
uniref:Uncharacterized protein n=1 Tax=Gadus morhua TaxID=8049 RepID=A0A8C5A6C2_GADMO